MIKWITNCLGTCSYSESLKGHDFKIIDVRDLVDKRGNSEESIKEKINFALSLLKEKFTVIICCDYGMSRSNAVATGILSKLNNIPFDDALEIVLEATKEEIKLEILTLVKKAIGENPISKMQQEKKKILVLGGGGDIGQSVIPILRLSHEVFSPTRQELDLNNSPVYLSQYCRKNDISHILSLAYPRKGNTYASFGEGLGMLRNTLEVLKTQNHMHLTYISCWVVFSGYKSSHFIVNEDTPLYAEGLYGEGRYFCEQLIENYLKRQNDLKITIIRLSSCYGKGDKPKFLYNFIRKALSNEAICTHKYINGFPKLQLTHIDDVSNALGLFYLKKPHHNGYYNLASNDYLSTFEIANKIITLTGSSSILTTNEINDYTANIFLETQRIQKDLQWKPKYSLDAVLLKLIEQAKEVNS